VVRQAAKRKLLVCTGSHCREELRKSICLQEAVEQLPVDVTHVACQKVCKGPVVGVSIDEEWQWFEKMGSRKAVRALVELIEQGSISKPLRKRRDRKRAGKRRT